MRVWTFPAIAAACAAGALLFAGETAQAAKKKQSDFFYSSQSQRVVVTRPRSRVTVQRPRSYLDPGNEVLPGERSYQEYAIPYGYSAIGSTTLGATYGWDRRPLNAPYDFGAPRGF
jgi:hypothetical protein